MSNERMVYKYPGLHEIHGSNFDYLIIDEDVEGALDEALEDGWSLTTDEAREVHLKSTSDSISSESNGNASDDSIVDDNAPPTRKELQLKAKELGIKFTKTTTDEELTSLINAKLGA